MTTIFDVAKKAGVSKSTVSRVLTNKGYVNKKTRQKVEKAISEVGYIPNYLARNFRNSQTRTIGFIINGSIKLLGEFIEKFIKVAESFAYEVVIYSSDSDPVKEKQYLDLLKYKQIDGLFILTRANDWQVIEPYSKYGPIATWHRVESTKIYSAYVDHYYIYAAILQNLRKNGHKYVGFVLNSARSQNMLSANDAIKKQEAMGIKTWKYICATQENYGESSAQSFLKLSEKPKVVFIYADYVAGMFMKKLRELDETVANQTQIISLDNSIISELLDITSIDLDIDTQAYNEFVYIYNNLNAVSLPLKKIRLKVAVRKSFTQIDPECFPEYRIIK